MCLLVRFELSLFWLDHQNISQLSFLISKSLNWTGGLIDFIIIQIIIRQWGIKALSFNFIELIVPTHIECGIGFRGYGGISSD